MPDPVNWKTRLEVTVDDKPVTAIDSFTPTFNFPTTPIHSIEADNIGAVFNPQTATFTMTLKAIGPNVAQMTELAITGKRFSISLAEKTGTDWTFKKLLFRECIITSANPSNVTIDGAPTATFSGMILGFRGDKDREA